MARPWPAIEGHARSTAALALCTEPGNRPQGGPHQRVKDNTGMTGGGAASSRQCEGHMLQQDAEGGHISGALWTWLTSQAGRHLHQEVRGLFTKGFE